ncbi:hypothetical protein [Streptomyces sp. NPDC001404]|uniref:hypothetical protein n=1 Tax=Streptomyces sp. NPDC001404 TaxID=3364571 RepID=UPI0036855773
MYSTLAMPAQLHARLLPRSLRFSPAPGDPSSGTFVSARGHAIETRTCGESVTVTVNLPDGTEQTMVLHRPDPAAVARAVLDAAARFDAADPAQQFVRSLADAIGGAHRTTWADRIAETRWELPGGGTAYAWTRRYGMLVHTDMRFTGVPVDTVARMLAAATDGQELGDAEGGGPDVQDLAAAAPALWLGTVLEAEGGAAVRRAFLGSDGLWAEVTAGRPGNPASVQIGLKHWLGPERALATVRAARP